MDEKAIIGDFLVGKNPGYSTVLQWIESVLFFNGWGHRIDPADVRQEALSAVLINLRDDKYSGSGLKGYVQSTCKNLCLMALRRSYKSNCQSMEGIEVVDPAGTPETDLLKVEEYERLKQVFSQLSSLCKRLMILKVFKKLKYREIGNRLDLSEGNARLRFHRCLEKAKNLAKEAGWM